MILSDSKILELVQSSNMIEPFIQDNINPASYNFSLNDILLTPINDLLNTKDVGSIQYRTLKILDTGLLLEPNRLYLGNSKERINLPNNIGATAEGRSSTARLGMSLHLTAGWCDPGFKGNVTLEIFVLHPIIIYPNMKCGQFIFKETFATSGYHGSYQNQENVPVPTAGRFY